ncbi:extracellular solute-binding protein [Sinorhizobium medicae]|uniref:extracellular solute-binding protein n=1 Tax=Sinorhizobium medicae TaxID=110321 RepID=UPI000FD9ACA3|nr:extracellular solute-binding protein [Sinorhizobium medicae]RVP44871.1 extracellular solute-binding protein [Sinorhizobium medicae]RVP68543.1 extracellular solute-binding protein [Sinorhizobium medicae]UWU12458.1 extracellular solute-binding protein [Sinorhizobium medicae]
MMNTKSAILAAFATAALSIGTAAAQQNGKIRVTAGSSDLNAMWVELANTYEELNPGITVVLDNSSRSYDDLVQATLRDAITNSLPDVSFQGANRLRTFTDRGLAVPLNQFLNDDVSGSRQALAPGVAAIGAFKGETYALGFGVAVPTVFYNLDLVVQAGGDPKNPPATFDEIIEIGRRITDLQEGNVGVVYQSNANDFFWQAIMFSQGASMMNADETKIDFDSPEGLKALNIIRKIGGSGQAAHQMSQDQARAAFAAGKVGIIFDSNSNLPRFEDASEGQFELAVGGFPLLSQRAQLPAAGSVAMMFATDPEQQKLAWDFMKFAAGPAGQSIVARKSGWLPANEYALRASEELAEHFAQNPYYEPMLKQVPLLRVWYSFPGENALKVTKVLVDGVTSVMTQTASPEDALSTMSHETRTLLNIQQ